MSLKIFVDEIRQVNQSIEDVPRNVYSGFSKNTCFVVQFL